VSAPVLIVEDDPAIGPGLVHALEGAGHVVGLATTGQAALEAIEGELPLVVLLDLGLPDIDGTVLCRQLRRRLPDAGIVVITARSEEMDAVLALDAGADDYVVKPFRLAELMARVRAHLRRLSVSSGIIELGTLVVDPASRRTWVDQEEVGLRAKEFDVLTLLALEVDKVVTRDRLMAEVWDEQWYGSTKTLDMTISSLRRKLGPAGRRITTLRSVGYRMERA
jgi:DNA-binding response OmpR family regulator